ncbi:MAG: IS21 family transposase [Armatimonadota bacterium]
MKGLSMRKIREILRLSLEIGLSSRDIAGSCSVSHSTVLDYLKRFQLSGLTWPVEMDDKELSEALSRCKARPEFRRPMPDIEYLTTEMRRKGVTLYLLWLEYKETYPEGYQYTQFCHNYNRGKKNLDVTMRQEYKAGEKLFTDYAGDTIGVTNPHTGEIVPAYIFVGALASSSYTYAEGVLSMDTASWISSHIRNLEYLGGCPEVIVTDNTKTAVKKSDRYEPDINPAFADMANYYGVAVIPARVRKPRDKAKVESAVLVVERWIMASLRNRAFFSLAELNHAISELLEVLNNRKLKKLDVTRRILFETIDKAALRPLPNTRYAFLEWKEAKVNIDYHISVDKHLYSVPYILVGETVTVRMSSVCVEILHSNKRVASHIRSYKQNAATTNPEHMPESHKQYLEWQPSRIIDWAGKIGPNTASLVEKILASRRHPEMGYRSCLGLIRLSKNYPTHRLEAACMRALKINALSYKNVKSILEKGLDSLPIPEALVYEPKTHENIRGKDYFNK